MFLNESISKINELEKEMLFLFNDQLAQLKSDSSPFELTDNKQISSLEVKAKLDILCSDLLHKSLQTILDKFLKLHIPHLNVSPYISVLSKRIEESINSIKDAGITWEKINNARLEISVITGGVNKEEMSRHILLMKQASHTLLKHISCARTCLQELIRTIDEIIGLNKVNINDSITCPIDGHICNILIYPVSTSAQVTQ